VLEAGHGQAVHFKQVLVAGAGDDGGHGVVLRLGLRPL
jgi:hypothetical protein